MRLTMMILLCLLLATILSASPFTMENENRDELRIRFEIPDFELEHTTDGTRVKLPQHPEAAGFAPPGEPDLPSFSTLIRIPNGLRPVVTGSPDHIDQHDEIIIRPSANPNEILHGTAEFHPSAPEAVSATPRWVELGEPAIMRGQTVVRLIVHPFFYDHASSRLDIARQLDIRIDLEPDASMPLPARSDIRARGYDRFVSASVLNPAPAALRDGYQRGSYAVLYDGSPQVLQTLQPLLDWKHRKGFEIHLLDTSTIDNNTNQILAWLQNAYQTFPNPPEYILIAADANGAYMVPTFFETYDSPVHGDYPYTLLDGDDPIPDAAVGRLTFGTINELQAIVAKILIYETQPPMDNNWLNNAMMVGDPYDSGVSTITTMEYIIALMNDYYSGYTFTPIYQNPIANQMEYAINAGTGMIFYRGFGSFSNWTANQTYNLANAQMNPPMTAITCFTGTFATGGVSHTELFLRVGTPGNPIGCSATIGSSSATHTCFNNIITGGIAYGMYNEGLTTMGEALNRGRIALYETYPSNPNNYVDWYMIGKNLFGDPGMEIWTRKPSAMTVTHPQDIPLHQNFVLVTVTDSLGAPIPEAAVTLLQGDDNIFMTAYTGANGEAVLSGFNAQTGTAYLTVSKHDFLPVVNTIDFVDTDHALRCNGVTQPQNLEAAATASFRIECTNNTTSAIQNATVTLFNQHPLISPVDSTTTISLGAGQTAETDTPFILAVSPNLPPETSILFLVEVDTGSWSQTYVVEALFDAPNPSLTAITVLDADGILDPGETADIALALFNNGSQWDTISATLLSQSLECTVTDSTAGFPDMAPGAAVNNNGDTFTVTLDPTAIPGIAIPMTLELGSPDGIVREIRFDIPVGEADQNDPTGPDAWGYLCYDDSDTGYPAAPVYDWIEIDPAYGGSGTPMGMFDLDTEGSGDIRHLEIPFFFRFYGRNYNVLTVSSNGFIMPGIHWSIEWMNWPIPGPMVPRPIIAPFWDDLLVTDGDVIYHYDEASHAIIIQWSRLVNRYDQSPETFQAILYDPVYNSTMLGDSQIKFQYLEVNNIDLGTYEGFALDHGEFCTVGIGDHTGMLGLQYTYTNQYPVTAKPLEDQMTLLFTGPASPLPGQHLVLTDIDIDDSAGNDNGLPDYGESIGLSLELTNLGVTTAEDISIELLCDDPFVTLGNSTATYPDLATGELATCTPGLDFVIAPNCPNNHILPFELHIHHDGEVMQMDLPIPVFSPQAALQILSLADGNDNQLEVGETGQFTIRLSRGSYHDVSDLQIEFSSVPEGLVFNPETLTIPALEPDSMLVTVDVTVVGESLNGESVQLVSTVSYNQYFQETVSTEYVLGHPSLEIADDFDPMNWNNWLQLNGYVSPGTNLAGGNGNEIHVESMDENYSLAVTRPINAYDVQKLIVEFDYASIGGFLQYGLIMAGTEAGAPVTFIWSDQGPSNGPRHGRVEYIPDTLYDEAFQVFFFIAPGDGQVFAIDNVEIYTVHHNPGILAGHVDIVGGDGSMEDVTVTAGYYQTTPDDNGDYQIELPLGNYDVVCELSGYAPVYVPDVQIIHDQTTTLDFDLQYLIAPFNLTYDLDGEHIRLEWEYEERDRTREQDQRSDDRPLDHFLVTMVFNYNFIYHSMTTDTFFERDLLANGAYEFYVVAVHEGGYESNPSNSVSFQITGADDSPPPPIEFKLAQNTPNPFNPVTTISYDIPQATETCRITVYNIRGEKIRTLVDQPHQPGRYRIVWNGDDERGGRLSSGVYLYRIDTDHNHAVRKAILMK